VENATTNVYGCKFTNANGVNSDIYYTAGSIYTAALFIESGGGLSVSSPYLKGNCLKGAAQGGLYLYANAMLSGMDNCQITGGSTYGV